MASALEELNNIEKLTDEETYQIWKLQISTCLKASGLFEIVSGIVKSEALTNEEDKTNWIKKDTEAQKLITMSIDKKILRHITECKTSKDMYKKIESLFEKNEETLGKLIAEGKPSREEQKTDATEQRSGQQKIHYENKCFLDSNKSTEASDGHNFEEIPPRQAGRSRKVSVCTYVLTPMTPREFMQQHCSPKK
ncbi:hypothetical protein ABEB36_005841 [Hypothenemus hampei]|uniref:Uncharacterized protein n=1 Tax=Hypothenemus hampei TaxID=57062 RepID=A0ABD1EZN1_HYPHA